MPRQPSVIDKHIGARLHAVRLKAGKSQTQVAEALGVTFLGRYSATAIARRRSIAELIRSARQLVGDKA